MFHEKTSEMPLDFRLYLQHTLVQKCKKNPSYSLRSFSNFLDLEPSALSKIIRGKRGVTVKMFKKISKKLDLTPSEVESFLKSIRQNQTQVPLSTHAAPDYRQLTLDSFQVIADWYHYAILELTAVKGFKGESQWISKKLGISAAEAQSAIERLIRLEYLKIDESGRWLDVSGEITTVGSEFTVSALKRLQRGILEKALTALEETPFEVRDQTSMTMAIDSTLLNEAKLKIKNFRRELCAFLQSSQNKDHVYHMGISLYPVTQIENLKENKE